jgi:predicted nuclease of predicted toxin-antitoxin system
MKLLFDHNLSPKLVHSLAELFPGSNHVYYLALDQVEDRQVWQYARTNNFIIVTKDTAVLDELCGSQNSTLTA